MDEEGGFFGGGLGGGEEGGLGFVCGWMGEEGVGEACWILRGGSVVFVVVVVFVFVVGGRHDDGMVSAKSDRMDISGPDLFFLSFVSLVATTTTRLSDGYSKVLICPSPFFLRDGKIEQIERVAAFSFLVEEIVDGVSERFSLLLSCGWLAGSSRKTL